MLRLLSLLLPCLIPSWRFFQAVEPSPRVQWRVLLDDGTAAADWRLYRPRPNRVSLWTMLRRLVWNPDWNEALFMVSLSERLTLDPTEHSLAEIRARVADECASLCAQAKRPEQLQFRLIYVSREDDQILPQTTYVSDPFPRAPVS